MHRTSTPIIFIPGLTIPALLNLVYGWIIWNHWSMKVWRKLNQMTHIPSSLRTNEPLNALLVNLVLNYKTNFLLRKQSRSILILLHLMINHSLFSLSQSPVLYPVHYSWSFLLPSSWFPSLVLYHPFDFGPVWWFSYIIVCVGYLLLVWYCSLQHLNGEP